MNILQVSPSDVGGGAENVALTLFREYRRRGHRSSLVVGAARTHEEGIFELDHDSARSSWARLWLAAAETLSPFEERVRGARRLRRALPLVVGQPNRWLAIRRGHEDFDFPATANLVALAGAAPDVVHAHNLHWAWGAERGYFDLRSLAALSHARPLFLTLHDAWLVSGHCAHSFACERWLTGCGQCPDLTIYPSVARDATAYNWRRKRDIFARSRLRIATPSKWLMDKVERSMLAAGTIDARVIPYGIDTSIFRPGDRASARAALGLPADTPIVLVAANGIRGSAFKDLALMRSAVGIAASSPLLFLAVGEDAPEERHGQACVRFVSHQDPQSLVRYYQAADVYVHAARADTFPLVVLEAMACGTPVVATAVGGIPEQVRDDECGLLVPPGDARAFADALQMLLGDEPRRRAMGGAAAADAAQRFALTRHVTAYLDWYAEALAEDAPRGAGT
ncbi:MAG TPA: glycosyltransferase [Gaiellaceae bacterium]|nr:glycosyltransferase [Gaiellaceae bacterium]